MVIYSDIVPHKNTLRPRYMQLDQGGVVKMGRSRCGRERCNTNALTLKCVVGLPSIESVHVTCILHVCLTWLVHVVMSVYVH